MNDPEVLRQQLLADPSAVATLRAADGRGLKPGDVYMLNAPYNGGTHLPDITVITPVFEGGRIVFFVARCAHARRRGASGARCWPPQLVGPTTHAHAALAA